MTKSRMVKGAELVSKFASLFQCPFCQSSMSVVDLKSLICTKNHTFDFTKQGYVNMMTHPSTSHYKKELFEARHDAITESNLYAPMQQAIANMIEEHLEVSSDPFTILDVGCGEGSHLQKIMDACGGASTTGVGLDISKEGIMMAARRYENSIWVVGDLAKSPFRDQSFHVILDILSPSNYSEFKRLLAPHGLVIKVFPRPHYLKELREELFDSSSKSEYNNDRTVSLFKEHFQLLDAMEVRYTKKLSQPELRAIIQMTPLAWSADPARIQTYCEKEAAEITVDLEVLIGVR